MFNDDQERAMREGWCASECIGSMEIPDGWTEIQACGDSDIFESDWEALEFVVNLANRGSKYHRAALNHVDQQNFKLVDNAREA